jgi:hypothetical protein
MQRALIIAGLVVLTLVAPGVQKIAAAQTPGPEPIAVESAQLPATPRVTVRFHAGPNLSLMKDWRNGMSTLQDLAGGTDKHCICMSWGSTALVHVTPRVAIGGAFEMLRDTRKFSVDGYIPLIGRSGTFGFGNETVVKGRARMFRSRPGLGAGTPRCRHQGPVRRAA